MPAARLRKPESKALAWLVTIAAGLLAVALIAINGGFERGAPYLGRQVEVGTEVQTHAWDFTVTDAIVTGAPGTERIAVRLLIRSHLTESHTGITAQSLIVRLPDGQLLAVPMCTHAEGAEGYGTFDPYVLSDAVCYFDPLYDAVSYDFAGDTPIDVVIVDQAEPRHDFERTGELETTLPIAYVPIVARWAVQ